jgi:hypothetical protein
MHAHFIGCYFDIQQHNNLTMLKENERWLLETWPCKEKEQKLKNKYSTNISRIMTYSGPKRIYVSLSVCLISVQYKHSYLSHSKCNLQ